MRALHKIALKPECFIPCEALLVLGLLVSDLTAASAENRVLQLDGKSDYLVLPGNMFNDLTEATIEGWVKWDAFPDEKWSRWFDFGKPDQDWP